MNLTKLRFTSNPIEKSYSQRNFSPKTQISFSGLLKQDVFEKSPRINNLSPISFRSETEVKAKELAKIIYPYFLPTTDGCNEPPCPKCMSSLENKLIPLIKDSKPIEFCLIGFPFKSLSRDKCISKEPDMAEECSLIYLKELLDNVDKVYKPGGKLIIANDGLMFSPIVVNPDINEATEYLNLFKQMVTELEMNDKVKVVAVSDFFPDDVQAGMDKVLKEYSPGSIKEIKERINLPSSDPNYFSIDLYNGYKRFAEEKMNGLKEGEIRTINIRKI